MSKIKDAIRYLITRGNIKFEAYNIQYTVFKDNPYFEEIKSWLKLGKVRKAVGLVNDSLKKQAKKGFVFSDNDLFYKGQKMPEVFIKSYKSCLENDGKIKSLQKFFDNVVANPGKMVSVEALARFITQRQIVITDRGTFLAYKRVNANYTDCHTGKMDNSIGKTVRMSREKVDHVQTNTCSSGLHVCSYGYLGSFGGARVIIVEVNPKNVVAVPPDYDNSKIRCCEYTVLDDDYNFANKVKNHQQDVLGSLKYLELNKIYK